MPDYLKDEINKFIGFENSFVSPLFHSKILYYQDLVFRFFVGNHTIATGGRYSNNSRNIVGFALFLDNIIEILN
jgi:histidyl-tRNA synthetase